MCSGVSTVDHVIVGHISFVVFGGRPPGDALNITHYFFLSVGLTGVTRLIVIFVVYAGHL